tara:strand:+ start:204 stop:1385 length:1182 start_codon:yes stop_codon:yes gene_type:complete
MYQVLYSGFDTLDIAFKGAFPNSVLETLETARTEAEASEKIQPAQIGPDAISILVKPNGRRGGFRYVFDNGPAGAIFAAKANSSQTEWNLFVSVRALRLLTLGYEQTKIWLDETLTGMGFQITDLSVNRIDYAVDILAPDFTLDIANFVTPGHAKARPYWSKESWFGKDEDAPKAVLRGRRFESVTIGTMPNRQVIIYDKRRAALDKRELHWFDAWRIDRHDPAAQVWRVEIRAGRDALAKQMVQRSYSAVEAETNSFLIKATNEIRYLDGSSDQKNISRIPSHRLWTSLQATLAALPKNPPPPLMEGRAIEALRMQRLDMALKQGFGNLLNALALDGIPPEEIAANFDLYVGRMAAAYTRDTSRAGILKKAKEIGARLAFLSPPSTPIEGRN